MKILFCISSMECGGAEKVISSLSADFCEGNEVHLLMVAVNENKSYYQLHEGIQLDTLYTGRVTHGIDRLIRMRKYIKRIKPDVIISFLPETIIYAYYASLGLGIPFIASERNDPHTYPKYKLNILRHIYNRTYCVFQTNDASKCYKMKEGHYEVIPNVVRLSYIPSLNEKVNRKRNIVVASRLDEQKNIPLILTAYKLLINEEQYKDYILNIYGKGPLLEELTKLIKDMGLENKAFLKGRSPTWHKDEYDAGCFVLSSIYEGMPNSLEEAASLGIPCVSTDCPIGGSKDLSMIFDNILLCEVNDPNDMLEKIKLALSMETSFKGIPDALSHEYLLNKWKNIIKEVNK